LLLLCLSSLVLLSDGRADHRDLHSFPTRRSSDLRGWSPTRRDLARWASVAAGRVARGRELGVCVVGPAESARLNARFRGRGRPRSEEHTSELQSLRQLVCRLLLEKKKKIYPRVPS